MIEQRNRFIRDVDLNEATSLTHLLDRHDREEDVDVEIPIIKQQQTYLSVLYGNFITS